MLKFKTRSGRPASAFFHADGQTLFRAILLALACSAAPAGAHEGHDKADAKAAPASGCSQAVIQCARSATPTFGPDGRVWLLWSHDDQLRLSISSDGGKTFPTSQTISPKLPILDDNSEARPRLVLLKDGSLLAAVTQRDSHYVGRLLTARSTDGGQTFSAFKPMLDNAGQRFETPLLLPNGRLVLAWLDWRNQSSAKAKGQPYKDSGVAVAWSDDNGQSFQGKSILADYSCDCCRLGAAVDAQGHAVFAWRHVFDGSTRDHAAARLNDDGSFAPLRRISVDDWKIDACPRHGPSISIGGDGVWHATWFTGAAGKAGIYYAQSTEQGEHFSAPQALGNSSKNPGRPQVLALAGGVIWRAWKEFDGHTTAVWAQSSPDSGQHWTAARELARTQAGSDHPLLLSSGQTAYLSWLTREEGYRLLPLAVSSP